MSWIKIRTNLATDPSVAAIGMKTRMHPREVVGCLVAVWCWADPLTADGRIDHATAALIDGVAGKRGFSVAMSEVSWLSIESDAVIFPKWDRHHSQSAKARAGETERKRIARESGQDVRKMSGQTSGQSAEQITDQRRGEERRGDENTNTPLPPKGGDQAPTDSQAESKPAKAPPVKGPLQLRAEALMGRRPTTPLTHAESRAFAKNRKVIEDTTPEDWGMLERFYALPQPETYARKELGALLNNWGGEIDKAKAFFKQERLAVFTPHVPKPRVPDNLRSDYVR